MKSKSQRYSVIIREHELQHYFDRPDRYEWVEKEVEGYEDVTVSEGLAKVKQLKRDYETPSRTYYLRGQDR